jgi:hypothetical protein
MVDVKVGTLAKVCGTNEHVEANTFTSMRPMLLGRHGPALSIVRCVLEAFHVQKVSKMLSLLESRIKP